MKEAKMQRALAAYVIERARRNKTARLGSLSAIWAGLGRRSGHERVEELKKLVRTLRPEMKLEKLKGSTGSTDSLGSVKDEDGSTVEAVLEEEAKREETKPVKEPSEVNGGASAVLQEPTVPEVHVKPPSESSAVLEKSPDCPGPAVDQSRFPDNQLGLEAPAGLVHEMEVEEEKKEISSPAVNARERQAFKDRAPLFELPDLATLTRDHLQKYFPELSSLESANFDVVSRLLLEAVLLNLVSDVLALGISCRFILNTAADAERVPSVHQ